VSTATSAERHLALELIDLPANVRELDAEHVPALAGSIALRGLIVPLVVRPGAHGRFILVAVRPLPPGDHTIHFTGTVDGFAVDVTYNITTTAGR
jgi:hypothetical protein